MFVHRYIRTIAGVTILAFSIWMAAAACSQTTPTAPTTQQVHPHTRDRDVCADSSAIMVKTTRGKLCLPHNDGLKTIIGNATQACNGGPDAIRVRDLTHEEHTGRVVNNNECRTFHTASSVEITGRMRWT